MDISKFIEPTVNLERITELLDGLGHEGRVHTIRTWEKKHMEALFEASKGYKPIDLDFVVPTSDPLVEVIHEGQNTVPIFSHFQKRFVKLENETAAVGGYNHNSTMGLIGPGYYAASKGEGDHEGEVVIDYTKYPDHKAPSWPKIEKNEGFLSGIVYGGMVDYLRGLSTHVSIGTAFKGGQPRGQFFALVRKDPS